MNISKILAYSSAGLIFILNVLQFLVPILPPVWANVVTSVLALFASYHFAVSHNPISLANEGYTKTI